MLTKQNVRITIHTLRRGIAMPLFTPNGACPDGEDAEYDYDESEELPPPDASEEEDGPEEAELMLEGRLVCTSQRVDLIYDESELTGMEGSVTKIGFHRTLPSLVTMLRSGSVNTALVFEAKKRHVCVYNTPYSAFEVCVQTLEISNRLLTDGELYLDYLIEIHGARTERCKMTLTIVPD